MHEGHRERMKQRALQEGLEDFASHEIAEYLMFFAIPRRDVNPLAHKLIEQFGSISNAMEADYTDILAIEGMTPNAAQLLWSIPRINRALARDRMRERTVIANWRDAGELALYLYSARSYETFMLLCLDLKKRIIAAPVISEGTLDESVVYPRRIMEAALKNKAKNIVLVHNHPAGTLEFSRADIMATSVIKASMAAMDISVVDHILIADGRYVSMHHEGLFENMERILAAPSLARLEAVEDIEPMIAEKELPKKTRRKMSGAVEETCLAVDFWAREIINAQDADEGR